MAEIDSESSFPEAKAPRATRTARRLSDKILAAFHHACDYQDLESADQLLRVLEDAMVRGKARGGVERRREQDLMVAAHTRLWHLRHPEHG